MRRQLTSIRLAFLCVLGIAGQCWSAPDPTVNSLVDKAATCHTVKSKIAMVKELETYSEETIDAFVSHAVEQNSEDARLIGVLASPRIRGGELSVELLAKLKDDSSNRVQEAIWLTQKLDQLDVEQRTIALESCNPIIRSVGFLASDSEDELKKALTDVSPLVRSVGIRRIGLMFKSEINDGLATGIAGSLVDWNAMVRSDALITARFARFFPAKCITPLILDDRALSPVEYVLGPEDECKALQQAIGIKTDYFPSVDLLRTLILIRTVPAAMPPIGYQPLIVPLYQEIVIGGFAANLFVESGGDADVVREFMMNNHCNKETRLMSQLEIVLGMREQAPRRND